MVAEAAMQQAFGTVILAVTAPAVASAFIV